MIFTGHLTHVQTLKWHKPSVLVSKFLLFLALVILGFVEFGSLPFSWGAKGTEGVRMGASSLFTSPPVRTHTYQVSCDTTELSI